ncbi:MAG: hypothetical protein ACK55I_26555 [bacterium]
MDPGERLAGVSGVPGVSRAMMPQRRSAPWDCAAGVGAPTAAPCPAMAALPAGAPAPAAPRG